MSDAEKVTEYIEKHEQWSEQLSTLRTVFNRTALKERVKWGAPSYEYNNKLIAGMAAFKKHYAVWFHQGVFLKDPAGKLLNAQEGKTKAMRQWRFEAGDTIESDILKSYLEEAIENCKAGKELKPERKKGVDIPPELGAILEEDPKFKESFTALSPGKQREFAAYISEAKRAETKQSRLEKITPMIEAGQGLYDKYKNC